MRDLIAIPVLLGGWVLSMAPLMFAMFWFFTKDYALAFAALAVFATGLFLYQRLVTTLEHWEARENHTVSRIFIQRYIGYPILTFLALGFIYPGAPLLAKWSHINAGDPLAYCTAFSHETVGIVLVCELAAMLGWAVLFRLRNDGVLALLEAVPFGLLMATWFSAVGLGIALCRPLPAFDVLYPLVHACLLPVAVYCIVWMHVHLPRTIEFNKHVYDFEKGRLALFSAAVRPDGATVKARHFVYVAIFFALAKVILDYLLAPKVSGQFVGEWEGVIGMTALGYLFLVLAASGISTAWHVARGSRGVKMMIKEFSDDMPGKNRHKFRRNAI